MTDAFRLYHNMKANLTYEADRAGTSDLAYRRECLNNALDAQIKYSLNPAILREKVSEAQGRLFATWLTSYTISRHSK